MHPDKRLKWSLYTFVVLMAVFATLATVAYAVEPQARVTQLPNDSQVGYVTIIAHDNWKARPGETALIEEWESRPEVAELAKTKHYNFYTERDPFYQHALKGHCPQLPAIMCQDSTGRITFKDHAEMAPGAVDVDVDVERGKHKHGPWLPWNRNAVVVQPVAPKPNVDVNVSVPPQPIPDKVMPEKPKAKAEDDNTFGVILAVACAIVAIVAGVVLFRKKVMSSSTV